MPIPLFPKIPHYRRGADLLHSVQRVACLEKLDGTHARVYLPRGSSLPGDLQFASRSQKDDPQQLRREAFGAVPGAVERTLALGAELDETLVLFGEVVGRGVQAQGFVYGHRPRFVLFAAILGGAWLSLSSRLRLAPSEASERVQELPSLRELAERLQIPLAPVLYEGPPDEATFDALRERPSSFARSAGRGDAPQEGIVIWSDPLLLDGAGVPLVAKHKDPRRSEILDKEEEGVEALSTFVERVVRLERLRHARQHLEETGSWERVASVWGARVQALVTRVIQDVAREVPEYQDQLHAHGKKEVREALAARVRALLPAFELEEP